MRPLRSTQRHYTLRDLHGKALVGFKAAPADLQQRGLSKKVEETHLEARLYGTVLDWTGTCADEKGCDTGNGFLDLFRLRKLDVEYADTVAPIGLRKEQHIEAMLWQPHILASFKKVYGRSPNMDDILAMAEGYTQLMCTKMTHTNIIAGAVDAVNVLRNILRMKVTGTTGFPREIVNAVKQAAIRKDLVLDATAASNDPGITAGRPDSQMLRRVVYQALASQMGLPTEYGFPQAPSEALLRRVGRHIVKGGDTVPDGNEGYAGRTWTVLFYGTSSLINVSSLGLWDRLSKQERLQKTQYSFDQLMQCEPDYITYSIASLYEVVTHINNRLQCGHLPNSQLPKGQRSTRRIEQLGR
ncbi:Hypothetical protein POVN_LOCUS138 [uncultured virus]|nr:Hypothetical protein POVN_LOCUS138 [uncultured virus]